MPGFVKLDRDIIESDPRMRNDPDYLAVWIWLNLRAAFKKTPALFGKRRITLKPGQLTTGRNKLSELTGVEPNKVYRILKYLKSEQLIEQQTTNHNSLISILSMMNDCKEGEQHFEQQMNNK